MSPITIAVERKGHVELSVKKQFIGASYEKDTLTTWELMHWPMGKWEIAAYHLDEVIEVLCRMRDELHSEGIETTLSDKGREFLK